MLATSSPDRIHIAFDDDRLVDHAGLLLPATLAGRLGLRELADAQLDLGDAAGRANVGDKLMTLIASALAGGDCIDDADAMRSGGAGRVLGCTVKAPSTLGTFLRSFRWGHVRQLDRVSRELLARSWAAGAGPGAAPFTIDLDSTLCETYGLAKEGARHHGYTGVRGYHPLLAVAAGTGEVLMARLRGGRANTARGAAHFLRETVARVRDAGASGQLTLRADSGFYSHAVVAACRKQDVRFSITIRQQPNVRRLIEAIPEEDWTPIPYWLAGGAAVAETTYTPFQHTGDATAVRLIVRRVTPTPGSQLALFVDYSYHAFITNRAGGDDGAGGRPSPSRRDRERDPRPQVRRRVEPSPLGPLRRERGVARGAGDRAQPRPLDGAPRARRGNHDDQDAQAALLLSRRTAHPLCPAVDSAPPEALALGRAAGSRARATTGDTAPGLTLAHSADPGPRLAPACPRTPRAPSRPHPQRPRAVLSDGFWLRPAPGAARRTPARPPNSPAARHPASSSFDRWIRAYAAPRFRRVFAHSMMLVTLRRSTSPHLLSALMPHSAGSTVGGDLRRLRHRPRDRLGERGGGRYAGPRDEELVRRPGALGGARGPRAATVTIKVTDVGAARHDASTLARAPVSEPTAPALDVAWTAAANGGATITGYNAQCRKKAAQVRTLQRGWPMPAPTPTTSQPVARDEH